MRIGSSKPLDTSSLSKALMVLATSHLIEVVKRYRLLPLSQLNQSIEIALEAINALIMFLIP